MKRKFMLQFFLDVGDESGAMLGQSMGYVEIESESAPPNRLLLRTRVNLNEVRELVAVEGHPPVAVDGVVRALHLGEHGPVSFVTPDGETHVVHEPVYWRSVKIIDPVKP